MFQMSINSSVVSKHSKPAASSAITFQSFRTLWRAFTLPDDVSAAQAASTLFRFFRSNHVTDLRLIFGLAIVVFLIHVGVIVGFFDLAALIALGTGLAKAAAEFKLAEAYALAINSTAVARMRPRRHVGRELYRTCPPDLQCGIGLVVSFRSQAIGRRRSVRLRNRDPMPRRHHFRRGQALHRDVRDGRSQGDVGNSCS
jgi:hypothetical protein